MNQRVAYLAVVLGLAGAISVGCGSDDDSSPSHGGTGGTSGHAGSAGKGGSSGHAGSSNESGSAGETSPTGGGGGTEQGGAAGAAGEAGSPGGQGGEGGEAGAAGPTPLERGQLIVGALAQCGSCHTTAATSTTPAGATLGGNPAFANNLGAPNLTDDPTGIGDFTDAQVIDAFRNGHALRKTSTGDDRQLSSVMPYWLFHNMSDADAQAVVVYLRSLPHATFTVVTDKTPVATAIGPLDPAALPNSSLISTDGNYAAAQQGKYLVSGIAQCVKCHSPASGGLPAADFFSGVLPATVTSTTIFAPNITPDVATGIGDWVAADVVTAIRVGTNKLGRTLCGAMANPIKGYAGMTDADANAIAIYLTTIPAVSKPSTDADTQNACP